MVNALARVRRIYTQGGPLAVATKLFAVLNRAFISAIKNLYFKVTVTSPTSESLLFDLVHVPPPNGKNANQWFRFAHKKHKAGLELQSKVPGSN